MVIYVCFSAALSIHPTLSLSHRVQKTVLYICVSFAVSHKIRTLRVTKEEDSIEKYEIIKVVT